MAQPDRLDAAFLSIQAQDFIEDVIMAQYRMRLSKFLSIQAQDFIEERQSRSRIASLEFLSIQAQDFIEDHTSSVHDDDSVNS